MESFKLGPYQNVPVKVRKSKQTGRFILRWNGQYLHVTVPFYSLKKDLNYFISSHKNAILKLIDAHSPSINKPVHSIHILGKAYTIKKDFLRAKGIWQEDNILWVGHKDTQLKKWLFQQALHFFQAYCEIIAKSLQQSFKEIKILDLKSRWGSCHSNRTLKFNWRLIMAPIEIAQYVAIHEVCHLAEMNHSPAFWQLVQQYCPQFKLYKNWLKREGKYLLAFDLKNLTPLE